MNIDTREIQEAKEEITKLSDDELAMLGKITLDETIRREAKKMILRLADQQK